MTICGKRYSPGLGVRGLFPLPTQSSLRTIIPQEDGVAQEQRRPDDTSGAERPHRDQASTARQPRRARIFTKGFHFNRITGEPRLARCLHFEPLGKGANHHQGERHRDHSDCYTSH